LIALQISAKLPAAHPPFRLLTRAFAKQFRRTFRRSQTGGDARTRPPPADDAHSRDDDKNGSNRVSLEFNKL
jgi:hypothetical protein